MISRAKYLMLNGEFQLSAEPSLMAGNRGFLYGEIVHRSMRANSGKAFFFDYYFDSLSNELQQRGLKLPPLFSEPLLEHDVFLLLQKNRVYQGAYVRISVFREANDAFFYDENAAVSVMIEAWRHPEQQYRLNDKLVRAVINESLILPVEHLEEEIPFYKTSLAGGMKGMAALDADVALLMNENNHIVQAADANIVLVLGNELYLPPQAFLITRDVICDAFFDVVSSAGYQVNENTLISPYDLARFDEALLLDSIHGMRWIGACGEKRFYHKQAEVMCELLAKASR